MMPRENDGHAVRIADAALEWTEGIFVDAYTESTAHECLKASI
jgi:hypothetical protein